MITRTVVECIGENMGPIDWSHEWATGMPPIWREAEKSPQDFLYNGRTILQIGMYDGWPYWKPCPAVQFVGQLGGGEWDHFNSYGCHTDSIRPNSDALLEERK